MTRHGHETGDKGEPEEKHMRLGLTLTGDQLTMADIVRLLGAGRCGSGGVEEGRSSWPAPTLKICETEGLTL